MGTWAPLGLYVRQGRLADDDPTVTLGIYAQAMTSSDNDRERLRLLVEGDDSPLNDNENDVPERAHAERSALAAR